MHRGYYMAIENVEFWYVYIICKVAFEANQLQYTVNIWESLHICFTFITVGVNAGAYVYNDCNLFISQECPQYFIDAVFNYYAIFFVSVSCVYVHYTHDYNAVVKETNQEFRAGKKRTKLLTS